MRVGARWSPTWGKYSLFPFLLVDHVKVSMKFQIVGFLFIPFISFISFIRAMKITTIVLYYKQVKTQSG